jgi:hypothetical protein
VGIEVLVACLGEAIAKGADAEFGRPALLIKRPVIGAVSSIDYADLPYDLTVIGVIGEAKYAARLVLNDHGDLGQIHSVLPHACFEG